MRDKLILALDLSAEKKITELLALLQPAPKIIKIGYQAVYSLGLDKILAILGRLAPESEIFLDLKLHDIPNTVAQAVQALKNQRVDYLTVHALGGAKMLEAAQDAAGDQIKLIAVTLLTSHSANFLTEELGLPQANDTASAVLRLAGIAERAGLRYIVSSARECTALKAQFPKLHTITPGIRLNQTQTTDDQVRVLTPRAALDAGADYLVIGRPIYAAQDPQQVWHTLIN